MNNLFPKKILVIRLSSIGDIVLTTAFVRILRAKFPNSQIDFLVFSHFRDIYLLNKNIDNLLTIEKKISNDELEGFENKLLSKNGKYDIIIDLHNNSRTKLIRKNLSNLIYSIDKRRLFKLGLVYLKIGKNKEYQKIHNIYMNTLKNYELEDDKLGLEFWLNSDLTNNKYLAHSKKFTPKEKFNIVIAPGAYHKTKMWLTEYYIELIELIKEKCSSITLLGGVNDKLVIEKISSQNHFLQNFCGKTSLIESAEIIDKADLLITNDTGLMHIAAARQVPVATFFGSTTKELGFEPFRVPNIILETELYCRPCTHIGRKHCPLLHFNCMKKITPQYAADRINDFLKSIYD